MKIALFDMAHWDNNNMKKLLAGHELELFDYSIHEENIFKAKDAEALILFMTSNINKETLNKFPNLELICVMGNSTDNIDMQACRERNVTVCIVPYHGQNSVAEHSFSLILALSRNLVPSVLRTRGDNFNPEGLEGFDLAGKTMGVIGTGHTGLYAIRMAKGFSMNVIAYDKNPQDKTAEKFRFDYVPLEKLLRESDVIGIYLPYNRKNHYFLNKKRISMMKKSAILVDVSQGPVVDDDALMRAVQEKRIAGAGLDFVEGEDVMKKPIVASSNEKKVWEINEELLLMKNVLITPNTAFNTRDALGKIEEYAAYNVKKYLEGEPVNVV